MNMTANRFTNLVNNINTDYLNINEEGEQLPPAPGEIPGGGELPPEEEVPMPVPEIAPEPGPQAVEDISLAKTLALQLSDLTPEDRGILVAPVDGQSIHNIRELLNSIAAKYDIPDV